METKQALSWIDVYRPESVNKLGKMVCGMRVGIVSTVICSIINCHVKRFVTCWALPNALERNAVGKVRSWSYRQRSMRKKIV